MIYLLMSWLAAFLCYVNCSCLLYVPAQMNLLLVKISCLVFIWFLPAKPKEYVDETIDTKAFSHFIRAD